MSASFTSRKVRILVVGGAEREARYDGRILEELAEQYPYIEVRFLMNGILAVAGAVG